MLTLLGSWDLWITEELSYLTSMWPHFRFFNHMNTWRRLNCLTSMLTLLGSWDLWIPEEPKANCCPCWPCWGFFSPLKPVHDWAVWRPCWPCWVLEPHEYSKKAKLSDIHVDPTLGYLAPWIPVHDWAVWRLCWPCFGFFSSYEYLNRIELSILKPYEYLYMIELSDVHVDLAGFLSPMNTRRRHSYLMSMLTLLWVP